MYYAICNKETDLNHLTDLKLNKYSLKNGKKTFLFLRIAIKLISLRVYWLVWQRKFAELWLNKCADVLFWNSRTRLTHDNTRTPSLLNFTTVEIYPPSINWRCFILLSIAWFTLCYRVSQISSEFESGEVRWYTQIGNLRFRYYWKYSILI